MTQPKSQDGRPLGLARARLVDVARLAGVSTKTASRVFSGETNVSEKTRQAVIEAAARLRFRPNILARNLRSGGATRTLGLVIGDLGNPFYFKLAAGIERELAKQGMNLIVGTTEDSPEIETEVVNAMLSQQVRALLIVPAAEDQSYLESEKSFGTPLIFVDRQPTNLIADSLTLTNFEGAKEATQVLIKLGHKKISFVANRAHLGTIQDRLRGYREAILESGLPLSADMEILTDTEEESLEKAFEKLLNTDQGPTAVIGGNNRSSIAYIKVSRQLGKEIAYIGFDDFELADALGISVVSFDTFEMGQKAAKLAVNRINNPLAKPRQQKTPTVFISRGSEQVK